MVNCDRRSTYSGKTLEAAKLVHACASDILDMVVSVQNDHPPINHGKLKRATGVLFSQASIFYAEEHL